MKKNNDRNDLKNWKKATKAEVMANRKAIEKKLGRPFKEVEVKHISTHIKFHPLIIKWAKAEAKKQGVGYQTVINQQLLKVVA